MTQTRDEQEALAVRFRTSVSLDEDELNLRRVPSQPGQPVTADDVAYVRLISCRRVVCGAAEFESNCFENFHLALTPPRPPARPPAGPRDDRARHRAVHEPDAVHRCTPEERHRRDCHRHRLGAARAGEPRVLRAVRDGRTRAVEQ